MEYPEKKEGSERQRRHPHIQAQLYEGCEKIVREIGFSLETQISVRTGKYREHLKKADENTTDFADD